MRERMHVIDLLAGLASGLRRAEFISPLFLGGDTVFRQVSVEYGFSVDKVVSGLPGVLGVRVAYPLDQEQEGAILRLGVFDDFFDFVFCLIVGRVVWDKGFVGGVGLVLKDELIWVARNVFTKLGHVENRVDARLGWQVQCVVEGSGTVEDLERAEKAGLEFVGCSGRVGKRLDVCGVEVYRVADLKGDIALVLIVLVGLNFVTVLQCVKNNSESRAMFFNYISCFRRNGFLATFPT